MSPFDEAAPARQRTVLDYGCGTGLALPKDISIKLSKE